MRAKPFPERARKAGPRMLEELERQETQEQLVIPRLEIAPPAPLVVENDQRQRRRGGERHLRGLDLFVDDVAPALAKAFECGGVDDGGCCDCTSRVRRVPCPASHCFT
jgi:hypothetical protein